MTEWIPSKAYSSGDVVDTPEGEAIVLYGTNDFNKLPGTKRGNRRAYGKVKAHVRYIKNVLRSKGYTVGGGNIIKRGKDYE